MKNNFSQIEDLEVSTREQLVSHVRKKFTLQYGNEPENVTLIPGRINIIGEHTDYNDGLAMPAAIDRWICGAISKSSKASSTIFSLNYNESFVISHHTPDKIQKIWKIYFFIPI